MPKERRVEVLFKEEIILESFGKSIAKTYLETLYPSLKITSIDSVDIGKDLVKMVVQSNILSIIESKRSGEGSDDETFSGTSSRKSTRRSIAEEEETKSSKSSIDLNPQKTLEYIKSLQAAIKENRTNTTMGSLYESFNQRLEKEINEIRKLVLKFDENLKSVKEEKEHLQTELDILRLGAGEKEGVSVDVEVLQMQLDVMKETIESLDNEKTKASTDNDKLKNKIEDMESAFGKERRDFKKQLKEASANVGGDSSASPLKKATTSASSGYKGVSAAVKENQVFLEKITSLEEKLKEKDSAFEEEKREMTDKISMLSLQNLNAHEKVEELEKESKKTSAKMNNFSSLSKEVEELRSSLLDKNQRISLANAQIQKLSQDIELNSEKKTEQTRLLDDQQVILDSHNKEVSSKTHQIEKLAQKLKDYEELLKDLNRKMEDSEQVKAELKETNVSLEDKNSGLFREKDEIQKKLNNLKDTQQSQDSKMSRMTISLGESEEKLQTKVEQFNEMEELFTRADSQISILQLKLEHDEKQSDLLKKEIHFLEETKKTNQEEKVHLKSRIQMVEDQIEGLNEKNLNLQTQKENMELTVKEKETKIELLSFNKEKMEQMVQSSSDLEIKYREKLEENHKTLIELAKKEEEYIENIKSLEGKVTEQEMEVLKLTSKLVEKETKIGSYREEQEKLKSQTSAAEKKLVDFQNEYKSVMDKFESMENQITDITIQNKNLQSRQGKFKELEEEITKSSSELHKLKQEKANTNKEITRLKEDNKNFIKDLTMKIEEVNATKTELAKMQAELKVQEEKAQIQIQAQKLSSSEKLIQLESSLNKAQSEKGKTEQELSELRKLVEGDVHSKAISQIKEQNEQLLKENAGLQRSLSEVNGKFEEGVGTQKEKEMRIQELENQIMVNKLKDMSELNEEELKAQVNEEIKNLSKELEDLKYEKLNKETEFEMKIMKEREKSSFALEENENQIHQLNQKVTSLSNIQTTEPYLKLVAEFEQSRDQNDQLELSQVASQKANLTLKQEIISLKKELFLKESTQSSLSSELAMLKLTFSQRANSASDDLALSAYAQLFKLLFHKLKELTLPTGKLVFADAETEHELDDEEEKAEKIPSEKEIVEMSSKIQKSLNLVELKFEEKDIIGENVILLKEILYLYQTLMTLSKERMEKKQGKSEQVNELVKLSNSLKDKLPNKKKLMIINTVNKDFFPFLYRIKIGTDTVPLLVPCIRTEIKHRQMKLTTYQDEFSKFRKIVTIAEGKYSMYEQKLKLRNNNIQP